MLGFRFLLGKDELTPDFAYDANGNQFVSQAPTNQLTTNSWDFENRLTKSALPTGLIDTFTYNGDGQRVVRQDSTGTSKLIWDLQNYLAETNATNIVQVVYSLEPARYGNLISQNRGGATSFYHYDGLGSTDRLSSSSGVVTDSYLYQAFGVVTVLSGTTVNPFKFVGRLGYYYDSDTQLYFLRTRYYHPLLSRFISQDPLLIDLHDNYSYTGNNPVLAVDPSGLARIQIPPIWGNYCGPLCPDFTKKPLPIVKDCLDSACADHDQCYGVKGYFNIQCDQALCGAALWCLRNGKCTFPGSQAAAIAVIAYMCHIVGPPGYTPVLPSPIAPPTTPFNPPERPKFP